MASANDATKARILSCLLLLVVPVVLAEKFPVETQDKPDTTISVSTELVLVPAVVTDRSGEPIKGLGKDDFTITEDGTACSIKLFEEISTDTKRVTRRSQSADSVYSNQLDNESSPRRLTVIVLDFLNTKFTDQSRGRRQLLTYLKEAVNDQEPTALFVLTANGVRVIQDFTTDPSVLARALTILRQNPNEFVTKDSGAAPDKMPGSFYTDKLPPEVIETMKRVTEVLQETQMKATAFQTRVAVTLTLESMQQIAHALEGIPGMKSLLWVSSGFLFDIADTYSVNAATPSDYGPPNISESVTSMRLVYAATWRALNQAQVSVYPVDIRGLQVELYIPPSIQNAGRDFRAQKTWEEQETLSTFNTFADMTGGKVAPDLAEGFREATKDSSHYYVIGYYLTKNDRIPGWHKLDVRVKRADAKIRARSGFLVTKAKENVAKLEETDIESALQSPLDFTAIPFRMQWTTRTPSESGKVKVAYQISIPPDKVTIDEKNGNHLNLELIAAAKSSDGKLSGKPFVQSLEAHLRPEMAQQIRLRGVEYGGEIELEPGEYNVRLLVRDDLTGKMGNLVAPLSISTISDYSGDHRNRGRK